MPSFARLLGVSLGLAAAFSIGITAWRLLDSPLRYDEASFALQAAGIVSHGVPQTIVDGNVVYGMWHPPQYLYSLAAFRALLGGADWVARLAGLAWFAGTAIVMWRVAGPWALSLALLSPLVAQGIFFVDIDNTSLAFAVTLFAAIFAAARRPHSGAMLMVLSGAFLLALWSKLTTPYIVLVAAGAFLVLNREAKGLLAIAAIGAGATVAFLAGYFALCAWAGYPWRYMFEFTYLGKRSAYLSTEGRSLVQLLHAVWWNVVWFSPALAALLGLMTLDRVRIYARTRRLSPVDFWVILAWAIVGAYSVWANVMGKYTFPAAIAASIALALWLPAVIAEVRLRRPMVAATAAVGLIVFLALWVPPLVVKTASVEQPALTIASAATHPRNTALAAVVGSFAVFCLAALKALSGPTVGRVAAALIACAAAAAVTETPKVMLAEDDRSPYRAFDERGFEDVVDRLNARASTDKLIGPKDIGYYFHGRSYALDGMRYTPTGEADVVEFIRRAGIAYAVDSTKNPIQDSDTLFRRAGLIPVEQAGDFVIYGRPR